MTAVLESNLPLDRASLCRHPSNMSPSIPQAIKPAWKVPRLGKILFRYEAPALADAANGALRRDAEH
ncbi:hypothetical protein [Cupriavidus sp. USMAA2-4]|uniref:hypothetical protein n=1 Tax=Cupriavidus sp. USMAA2-4 TaxID=876364 RepID=UPI0012F5297D|nr:hypothetical protein [Cupriavidus sp. USMAA2-4]